MSPTLHRAQSLRQALLDFTLDAEGEFAAALEAYSAEQLSQLTNSPYQGSQKTEQVINSFALDGAVGSQFVLDLFLQSHSDLPAEEAALVTHWRHSFMGLFTVKVRQQDCATVMNWLTEKQYNILLPTASDQLLNRLQPQEVVLTRLLPLGDYWMLSEPTVFLGKLGKPKLAVAIGSFKKYHKEYLYGDAPELLEAAWESVENYHQSFVDYFNDSKITLSGHQLEKQLAEFQASMAQQQIVDSGLDGEKSLSELADEAGVLQTEMTETAAAMGIDENTTARLLKNQKLSKMMTPKIELPPHLKNEDQVTLLTHPRWGQVMISTYQILIGELQAKSEEIGSESQINQSLKNIEIKPFVWHQLAEKYPEKLEQSLRTILDRPRFNIGQDLEQILVEFGHPEEPELPETASVPVHLHDLFQEAMGAVKGLKPSKSKGREKKQKKTGFG
ncbi:hypothetical protein C1752_07459 [Acaryochloris thomasi RCC1774]|uniref:Uncharacterized protein n=1 Tax=Acaryochloris thomasi RCC1774 TaxID=1764569 RepID=A0A2W1JAN3_9CYAN|nr:hypothetical protein [Acaryochloris thomasi]PZD71183.1 hypothetical protein C1752_07459 [Acaryochloris thomasi RCC1774]